MALLDICFCVQAWQGDCAAGKAQEVRWVDVTKENQPAWRTTRDRLDWEPFSIFTCTTAFWLTI
eukprot:3252326-Amphidinium_carterae.1